MINFTYLTYIHSQWLLELCYICTYVLPQEAELVGETLLESAEEFGIIISSTLARNTSNIISTHEPNIEKENVGKYIIMLTGTSYEVIKYPVVVQTVQLAKEEITEIESSGFISFLNDTDYSTFQGKHVSVNYPSNTIKERLPDGMYHIIICKFVVINLFCR